MTNPQTTVSIPGATSINPTSGSWLIVPGIYEAVGPAEVTIWVGTNSVSFDVPQGVPIRIDHGASGTTATVTIG